MNVEGLNPFLIVWDLFCLLLIKICWPSTGSCLFSIIWLRNSRAFVSKSWYLAEDPRGSEEHNETIKMFYTSGISRETWIEMYERDLIELNRTLRNRSDVSLRKKLHVFCIAIRSILSYWYGTWSIGASKLATPTYSTSMVDRPHVKRSCTTRVDRQRGSPNLNKNASHSDSP